MFFYPIIQRIRLSLSPCQPPHSSLYLSTRKDFLKLMLLSPPAFNSLSHPLASPFSQKLSPSTFSGCAPRGFSATCWGGGGGRSQRCQAWSGNRRNPGKGSTMMGGGKVLINERLGGVPLAPRLFLSSVSEADFIDFSNLKHSHCRAFHRPIDWN